jgi:hypothetical protein
LLSGTATRDVLKIASDIVMLEYEKILEVRKALGHSGGSDVSRRKQNKRCVEDCGGMNSADSGSRTLYLTVLPWVGLGLDNQPRAYTRAWSDTTRPSREYERFGDNITECADGKLCSVARADCS